MERFIYKRFTFLVDTAAISYNRKFDLDKSIVLVHGIQVTSDKPNLLFYRGSQRVEINGDEIYPEDYDSKLLLSGLSVPPEERFVSLGNGVVAGNGEVKILYKDAPNDFAFFSPYNVQIILKCEYK